MRSSMRLPTKIAVAGLFVTSLSSTAEAQAPSEVPYEGLLQTVAEDGTTTLVDGPTALRFTVYSVSDGPPAAVWTEEWSDQPTRSCSGVAECVTEVHGGFFSVGLGRWADGLPDVILDADPLYLGIAVYGELGWVDLGGFQRFSPVPYAAASNSASNLTVVGDVTFTTSLEVSGALSAGALDATSVNIDGQLQADSLSTVQRIYANDVQIDGDFTGANSLYIESGDIRFEAMGDIPAVWRDGLILNIGHSSLTRVSTGGTAINGDYVCGDAICGARFTLGSYFTEDSRPFRVEYNDFGNNGSWDTNISAANWTCWVAGFDFSGGNPQTNSGSHARAYARVTSGEWHVFMDFSTESGNHDDHRVALVCADADWSQQVSGGWY